MRDLFLKGNSYPWTSDLAQRIHRCLVDGCPPSKTELLVKTSGMSTGEFVFVGTPPRELWMRVLDGAFTAGKLVNLFQKILEDATLNTAHPLIHEAMTADRSRLTAELSRMPILPGEMPFFDRSELRSKLQTMLGREQTTRPILIVRGAPSSGKSFTRHLIAHVAEGGKDGYTYLYEGNATTVDEAVKHVFDAVALQPPPRATTADAWYGDVWDHVRGHLRANDTRWWIVVDDLAPDANGQPRMDREVLELFHKLALKLMSADFAKYFRLVLLDYPEGPNHPPSKLKRDVIVPDRTGAVSDADLAALVETHWGRRGRQSLPNESLKQALEFRAKLAQRLGASNASSEVQTLHDVVFDWLSGGA